jgi:hypothetical protein
MSYYYYLIINNCKKFTKHLKEETNPLKGLLPSLISIVTNDRYERSCLPPPL